MRVNRRKIVTGLITLAVILGISAAGFGIKKLVEYHKNVSTSYSQPLEEEGTVVKKKYVPSSSRIGYGMKFNGKMGMKTIHEPEEHNVYIKSETFGSIHRDNHKLFNSVEEGQTVTVVYKKKFRTDLREPLHRRTQHISNVIVDIKP